jgi:hypothetical protein
MYMYTKEVPDPDNEGRAKNLRLCLTGTTEEYVAKDRTGKLPLVVEDPTMLKIHNYIFETE